MNCALVGLIKDLPYMYTDLHVKMPVNYCQILMKLEFSRQIFEMYSDFLKIRSVGAEFYPDRHKGRRDEANSLFSQFCESA
jgi:hypothetical protein